MKIIVAGSPEIASHHATNIISQQLNKKPNTVFLLPTGSTPLPLYRLLTEKVKTGVMSFAHAQTFNLDEYLGLDENHPQSYHRFMQDNLFSKIDVKKSNIFIPATKPKKPKRSCQKYEEQIARSGIDLAILGIGHNGHLAFNEPGTSFSSRTHIAKLSPLTIKANSRFFASPKQVPRQATTVGLKTIMSAKRIILLAFGPQKAQIVAAALEGNVTPDIPASLLQKHKHITVILDYPAVTSLKKSQFYPPQLGNIRLYSNFNLPRHKKIVFFSPHPDDAAICAGALLPALTTNNAVHEIIVTTGHHAVQTGNTPEQKTKIREKEALAEAKIMGTNIHFARCRFYDNGQDISESDLKRIRDLVQKIEPDIAFVPQKADPHPTHFQARKIALASLPHDIDLWSFETPWGLFGHKKFNAVFEFSEELMRKKLRAIKKHKSQIRRTSFDAAASSIAHFRKITIAEQFFSALGQKPLPTEPYLELFNISRW